MLEWETLTCHLLPGLPSSWRVSALIFVMGLSHLLVLSHSWVSLHTMICAALTPTLTHLSRWSWHYQCQFWSLFLALHPQQV